MPLFIAGVFRDRGLAERVVTALLDDGVPSSEISMVVREEAEEDLGERENETGGEFAALATHSAWERLGWPGGARPPYRDKFPPQVDRVYLAAGPLAIAIGGAQLGACSGGIVGAMDNFGFTLDLAREWLEGIGAGGAWVMVRTTESQAGPTRRVFDRYAPVLPAESLRHW